MEQCLTDMTAGQLDQNYSPIEVRFFQVTLGCGKLTVKLKVLSTLRK